MVFARPLGDVCGVCITCAVRSKAQSAAFVRCYLLSVVVVRRQCVAAVDAAAAAAAAALRLPPLPPSALVCILDLEVAAAIIGIVAVSIFAALVALIAAVGCGVEAAYRGQ